MAPSSTESLAERGYTVTMRGGRLHISPAGAPAEILAEVREHSRELIAELLHVPDHLADWTLEEMRALAFTMQAYIDGPADYEQRIAFLPEFERLVERIGFRMEETP